MNSNDWVAEYVMGFERKNCWGPVHGYSDSSDGMRESWFYCKYCGRQVYSVRAGPCSKYPFPKFTLVDLMRKLGEMGDYVMVRYDALRSERNFTVSLNAIRIADTDDPLQALCDYLYRHQSLYPPKGKHFVSGQVCEFEPGHGWRKAAPDWGLPCLRSECCFRWWHPNISPAVKEPSPALFANIRDAIKLLQKVVNKDEGRL